MFEWMSNVTSFGDFFTLMNTQSGSLLTPLFVVAIAIIVLMNALRWGRQTALLLSSMITFISTMLLSVYGIMPDVALSISIAYMVASIFYILLGKEEEYAV